MHIQAAKLNFMGNELAQLKEWCEKDELDWILLKFPIHEAFHKFHGRPE